MLVELDGDEIEIAQWNGSGRGRAQQRSIVLLHEGLGSVSAWGDFPERLAALTCCRVLAYSRAGYGSSTIVEEPFDVDYMHREAEVLNRLLDRLQVARPILFGHSDGASIALIAAARYPERAAALVLEAPHVFVEDLTVKSIAEITAGYPSNARLRRSLARHHRNADLTFRRWSDIWLNPAFREWNITACLPQIAAPVLVFQGAQDEYGTALQLEAIVAAIPQAECVMLEDCRHSPHRDARNAVLERTADFVQDVRVA